MANPTLEAIMKSNTIFVSAQPDHVYFHWQVELYMYQFAKYGIVDQCYALFGYTGDAPSNYAVELSKRYNIFFYKDTRNKNIPHYYIPSIRPHILKQFFQQFPNLGKLMIILPIFQTLHLILIIVILRHVQNDISKYILI